MDEHAGNPLADGLSQSASRAAELAAIGMMALATAARRREQELQADEDRRVADERREAAEDLQRRLDGDRQARRGLLDHGRPAAEAEAAAAELAFAGRQGAAASQERGEPDPPSIPHVGEHADLGRVAEQAEVLADRALAKAAELAAQGAPKPPAGSLAPPSKRARDARPPARAVRATRGR